MIGANVNRKEGGPRRARTGKTAVKQEGAGKGTKEERGGRRREGRKRHIEATSFKPKGGKTNVRKAKRREAVAYDVYRQFRTRDLCMETHIQSRICACRDGRGMQGEDERRGGDNS